MKLRPLPGFARGAYTAKSAMVAGTQLINMYSERVPPEDNKARAALYPIHGTVDFGTLTDGPGRAIGFHVNRLFTVFGQTLFELGADGSPTTRGSVRLDGNPAYVESNGEAGNDLIACSGGRVDHLDLVTGVYTEGVLDEHITHIGLLDGFLLALDSETGTLYVSESLAGETWDPTQATQRTAAPDPWRAMTVVNREIYLLGGFTGDVWYNRGSSPFPLAARPGGFFEVGIAAPFSLTPFGQTVAWLGQTKHGSGRVYWLNGYAPNVISTPAIEWSIQQINDTAGIDDCVGWSYERDGHQFLVLDFPAGGITWCFDAATNEWHQRAFWDSELAVYQSYRPRWHTHGFGKNLVLDSQGFKVYSLSSTVFTDVEGHELRRVRRTPRQFDRHMRRFYPAAQLECARGVGTTSGQGQNPKVGLRYSNDGGNTWGVSRMRSVGAKGKFTTRVRWNNCGSGVDRVWELWTTDPAASYWFDFYVP